VQYDNYKNSTYINKKYIKKIKDQITKTIDKNTQNTTVQQDKINDEQFYYFVQPTVLSNVTLDMKVMQEETFGPVAPVMSFSSIEEALEIANGTPFGLAAYFFTNDYRTGTYLHDHLNFGIVGWNDTGISAA